MAKVIAKKILPEYFGPVSTNKKTFELRKDEDDLQSGDILILKEWDGKRYTGREARRKVTYVLRDCKEYGLMDGYCIVAIKPFRIGECE